jgi:hypothetical protein
MAPSSDGSFRFETDFDGNRLTVGSYAISVFADQYLQPEPIDVLNVTENENRNVGDIRLQSLPIRFTEIQPCANIPATGGDCVFSVKLTNGTNRNLSGKVWNMVNGDLTNSFIGFTNFQPQDPQDLDLGKGRSRVFRFRFSVPASPGPNNTYICTRVFVGEGPQPFLNTIRFGEMFCISRTASGFAISSPQAIPSSAQRTAAAPTSATEELEPNNSCQTAQDAGTLSGQFVMNGNLDSSQVPDVDFFHLTGTPGAPISIDLEGQSTGKGTLPDPFLGFFDSNCNVITISDDYGSLNSHIDTVIPADGIFVLGATTCCDGSFTGGGNGTYQLTVTPMPVIGSIRGVVTDAVTGRPLRGDAAPFAFVRLVRCEFGCFELNSQLAGSDGSFHFETDYNGVALQAGDYMIVASADQYQFRQTDIFTVGEGENYNAGRIALQSFPIRFSDIQYCTVSSNGGLCDFSVKITNGLSTRFSGKAWSIVSAFGTGSLADFSNFQPNPVRDVSLDPGRSTVLRFQFQVRGSVRNGAGMCVFAYVGANPGPFFNTTGFSPLFCFEKGSNGFTLMSEQQMHQQIQQVERHEATPAATLPIKK